MMRIGYNIPLDLIFEILLRLPGKSVLRFKSVSKSWLSIISSQQFTKAFMSLSLSRPRLLLGFDNSDRDRVFFFSAPHQSSSFLSSYSVLVAEQNALTMPNPESACYYICNSVHGFFCCCIMNKFMVCNPTTGQVIPLPQKKDNKYFYRMYLGYDPKSDQYKVLRLIDFSSQFSSRIEHSVCTLGGQGYSHSWRPIKTINILDDICYGGGGVCIDGIVYYALSRGMLGCFDVGSEQVRLISEPIDVTDMSGTITNYLGKLAVFCCLHYEEGEFGIWVLDDVKNQFWSKKTFVVPSFRWISITMNLRFQGITGAGEIVFGIRSLYYPFDFLCYDVEKKIDRSFRVEGLEDYIYEVDDNCFYSGRNDDNCSILKIKDYCSSLLCSYVENIIYL